MTMDLDKLMENISCYRRWHLAMFLLLGTSSFFSVCLQGLGIIFIGWEPPHKCAPSTVSNDTVIEVTYKRCETIYTSNTNHSHNVSVAVRCDSWIYDSEGYTTIVTEFNLVCEKDFFVDMSQIIYQIGMTVGNVICSYITDHFGRKKVHIVSQFLVAIFGTTLAFSPNYITFVIFRTLTGIFVVAGAMSGITLLLEMFNSTRRTVAGIGLEFMWIPTYLLPGFLSYFIKDWRVFQISASCIVVIWVFHIWFLNESIPWLLSKGKIDEAEETVKRIARLNKIVLTEKIKFDKGALLDVSKPTSTSVTNDDVVNTIAASKSGVPVMELFKDAKLRRHLIISSLLWFSNAVVYYGLVLATPSFGWNRYLTYSILGIVEIPAYIVIIFTVMRYGRRIPQMLFFFIAGISMGIRAIIPSETGNGTDLTPILFTLAMIAKFAISGSYSIMFLYIRELFPTNLRSIGTGICGIGGGVGNMLAPVAAYLVKHTPWLPNICFTVIPIVAGILVLPLPETLNKPLPQDTADAHVLLYDKKTTQK